MRILHLISSLSGGGAEQQLQYLAPELARHGQEVHVAYLYPGLLETAEEIQGVQLHRIQASNNYDPRILFQVLRLIRHIRPQVIQSWIIQMDIIGGIAAWLNKIPFVIREPSSMPAYATHWKHQLRIKLVRGRAAVICNSHNGQNYWAAVAPKKKTYVVPNAIDFDSIKKASEGFLSLQGLTQKGPMIVCVARMTEDRSGEKNVDVLIQALPSVLRQVSVTTVLCGDGPRRKELESLAKRLGIAQGVHFTGYIPNIKIFSILKHAAVFVSLSSFEGFPNAVIEAMACGCPVVVSDIPAHREFLDDDTAIFVRPKDPRAVAAAILDVLANPVAARESATKAKAKARHWSISAMAQKYEDVYKEVAGL